jgi:hypothetical protein
MKRIILTVSLFLVIFGFAVSGAMAAVDGWVWTEPMSITNSYLTEFKFDEGLKGWDQSGAGAWTEVVTNTATSPDPLNGGDPDFDGPLVDSVGAPFFVAIDSNTVGILRESGYVPFTEQPGVPNKGVFTHITADITTTSALYVIFENNDGGQWLIVGTNQEPLPEWTKLMDGARFTPRSLNLGSNGKWVTCKVNEFGYDWDNMTLANLCIVGINNRLFNAPICVATDGPVNTKNKSKMMAKFDRRALAGEITEEIAYESAAIPPTEGFDPTKTTITLTYSDETSSVYWEDTIKTKPAKEKKPKKDK